MPGDSKYGRLFTERDVERIIAEALIRQHTQQKVRLAGMLEHLDPQELTFPADEPLFVLRGQDRFAPAGIASYGATCINGIQVPGAPSQRCSEEHADAVNAACGRMIAWQDDHPDQVKIPD